MAMDERRPMETAPHSLSLEDRRRLLVSGVTDVESFNEQEVIMGTSMGALAVRGQDISLINDLQKSIKANRVISFLGGGAE